MATNLILFDNERRDQFLPFTFTRPSCELRVGILTIAEKWAQWMGGNVSYITQEYLAQKYPIQIESENFVINGSVMPNDQLVRLIQQLEFNEALMKGDELIAVRLKRAQFDRLMEQDDLDELTGYQLTETPVHQIQSLTDILSFNEAQIITDFQLLPLRAIDSPLPEGIEVENPNQIYIHPSATICKGTILNASEGPIYIGPNTKVMEGVLIRGPFALGEYSVLKMGAKIYGPTSFGPYSKVGGEVNHSVFIGFSNKGHDGFLGHSVIGEWCNIGADSNNSNLKNNYKTIKLWNYPEKRFIETGQQFSGLFMGDHSKCGINTMFNTGTVTGIHCNIYGEGFPRNFIPSFSWGGTAGWKTHQLDKALETAEIVMERRAKQLSDIDRDIFRHIFDETAQYRSWEKSPSGKK